jgi:hypothetical protein
MGTKALWLAAIVCLLSFSDGTENAFFNVIVHSIFFLLQPFYSLNQNINNKLLDAKVMLGWLWSTQSSQLQSRLLEMGQASIEQVIAN